MDKGGGDEMVHSLATLFNRTNKKTIPIQWRETKIKSIYKGGNIEQIQESHKGIFLIDMCKVYERVKKIQNENKKANILSMQTTRKKNRSTMDNLIIMSAIIEKQRQDYKNTCILYTGAEKCYDKVRLKDSLREMKRMVYVKNDIKILYETSKTTKIAADSAIGHTESTQILEVVKQGSIFGHTMCCNRRYKKSIINIEK